MKYDPGRVTQATREAACKLIIEGVPVNSEEWLGMRARIRGEARVPCPCVRCGLAVEEDRECYAIPHCHRCLPPPPPVTRLAPPGPCCGNADTPNPCRNCPIADEPAQPGDRPCGCEDSQALQAQLTALRARNFDLAMQLSRIRKLARSPDVQALFEEVDREP